MAELVFVVEEAPEGGFIARLLRLHHVRDEVIAA